MTPTVQERVPRLRSQAVFLRTVTAFLIGISPALLCPLPAQAAPPTSVASPSAQAALQGASPSAPPVVVQNKEDVAGKKAKDAAPRKPLRPPVIHAASAILIDAVSGQVLFEKNADAPRPPASTTKIMTALLFCEHVPENAVIVASKKAAATRESSLHLKVGEKLTAHDLLRAILMRSANDACVAAAEHIAGSEAAFADMMNTRAAACGATNTHFDNSNGLPDSDHYTSARDLALITREALREPRISEVVRTRVCRICRSIDEDDLTMHNHSHFLGHFPGADGVKTGWTIAAGHCYVGSATWNGWRLISVVLHSPNYVQETSALMKFGFYNFAPHIVARPGDSVGQCPVAGGTSATVPVTVKQPVQVVSRKGADPQIEQRLNVQSVAAPVAAGTPAGTLEAWVGGKRLCASPLVTTQADALAPASAALKVSRGGHRFWWGALIFGTCLVSFRYGTRRGARFAALTKTARRRRRRLATFLRSDDNLR